MKYLKYIAGAALAILLHSCTDDVMDEVNRNVNDPEDVQAINELPAVIVESSFGTTGTDIAWYASVFIEHNAGAYGQMESADKRTSVTNSSTYNDSWRAIYDNLMTLKDMIGKCSPDGPDSRNQATLGIAQLLTAYNLAVLTDMWGQAPWKEALNGLENMQPKFDKQQDLYTQVIIPYLNTAIVNLSKPVPGDISQALAKFDLMYGGDMDKWVAAAYSLKARYFLHLEKVVPHALDSVLAALPRAFSDASQEFVFRKYQATSIGENPWFQFYSDRYYLAVGKTLYDLMAERKDPRIGVYFIPWDDDGNVIPAPPGEAVTSQGDYSVSTFGNDPQYRTLPTALMSYHELKFIEAEARSKKGQDYTTALKEAVAASFAFYNVQGAEDYYTTQVAPRLGATANDHLKEIITQKYISFYEGESIEAYNDYRRTRIPQMKNPKNTASGYGFVERFAYPSNEVTANPGNVPKVSVYTDKIWWAGGKE